MRDRGFKNGMLDEFYLYDRVLAASEIERLTGNQLQREEDASMAIFRNSGYASATSAKEQLYAERQSFGNQRQRLTEIMVMKEMPGERETHILERGHYENRGKVVQRATPEVLTPFPQGVPNNRMGLAKWLTNAEHPLLARVTVNRYWQMIFGRGLVSTSEDFGMQGKPPTHLNCSTGWPVTSFLQDGTCIIYLRRWCSPIHTGKKAASLKLPKKKILKITTQPITGLSLTAEMIRDGLLSHSKLLHKKVGGGWSQTLRS